MDVHTLGMYVLSWSAGPWDVFQSAKYAKARTDARIVHLSNPPGGDVTPLSSRDYHCVFIAYSQCSRFYRVVCCAFEAKEEKYKQK